MRSIIVNDFFNNPFPVIDLGNMLLRAIEYTDTLQYYQYMNHKLMKEFITSDNIPATMSAAREELAYWGNLFSTKRSIYWGVAEKETDKLIGTAGFNSINFDHKRAEISYDLDPQYWGGGRMSKVIDSIVAYAELKLDLQRIQATVMHSNARSIRLLEKTGFSREGTLKAYEIVNGKAQDYFLYARLNQ